MIGLSLGIPARKASNASSTSLRGVDRLARGHPVLRQEGAEGRLTIARRPDFAGVGKGARHALDEQIGAVVRIAVFERGVPARAAVIAGRVDEKDRGVAARRRGFGSGGGRDQLVAGRGAFGAGGFAAIGGGAPGRRIVLHARPREPHFRIVIGVGRNCGLLFEFGAGHESGACDPAGEKLYTTPAARMRMMIAAMK